VGSLADLDRRLSRKIEGGKAIQLSADDLDLLVSTGAIDTFRAAVAEQMRDQCRSRNARSRSISGADTPSTEGMGGRTSKSSGTTKRESASEAKARLQAILGRPASH